MMKPEEIQLLYTTIDAPDALPGPRRADLTAKLLANYLFLFKTGKPLFGGALVRDEPDDWVQATLSLTRVGDDKRSLKTSDGRFIVQRPQGDEKRWAVRDEFTRSVEFFDLQTTARDHICQTYVNDLYSYLCNEAYRLAMLGYLDPNTGNGVPSAARRSMLDMLKNTLMRMPIRMEKEVQENLVSYLLILFQEREQLSADR